MRRSRLFRAYFTDSRDIGKRETLIERTWGYDYSRSVLWVDGGCRGRFGTR